MNGNLNDNARRIINNKLSDLSKSKFRSSFHLRKKELAYIDNKGLDVIRKHARDFILKNLAPAVIPNDGSQTPMKNHPVFIAQHATGTCCRGCLEKWHHISKGEELSENQVNYVVELIMAWIKINYEDSIKK